MAYFILPLSNGISTPALKTPLLHSSYISSSSSPITSHRPLAAILVFIILIINLIISPPVPEVQYLLFPNKVKYENTVVQYKFTPQRLELSFDGTAGDRPHRSTGAHTDESVLGCEETDNNTGGRSAGPNAWAVMTLHHDQEHNHNFCLPHLFAPPDDLNLRVQKMTGNNTEGTFVVGRLSRSTSSWYRHISFSRCSGQGEGAGSVWVTASGGPVVPLIPHL
ncbi:hypothetical protein EYF80_013422 [Liparis tanakae]|uniref:Uncharacterized protein n=1 Tax=Liparis tanakae TaxID=230148 RepID=A0A4Z2IGQ8_9TELE|nr:hypothetical protein EYF80_013422 [Liparis tanakae]